MKFTQIKETCLYIQDLEKAKDFYHHTLGLQVINYVADKHLFLRVGNSVLLCFNPGDSRQKVSPPAHFATGKQHIAFEVSEHDYVRTKEELRAKKIAITDEVIWPSGKESFYFEDPAGNVLEIVPGKGIW